MEHRNSGSSRKTILWPNTHTNTHTRSPPLGTAAAWRWPLGKELEGPGPTLDAGCWILEVMGSLSPIIQTPLGQGLFLSVGLVTAHLCHHQIWDFHSCPPTSNCFLSWSLPAKPSYLKPIPPDTSGFTLKHHVNMSLLKSPQWRNSV